MRKMSLVILFIWITARLIYSADPAGTELFPEVEGWKFTPNERVYVPSDLWDIIDGAADSYLSYNFIDLHLGRYENSSGIKVQVELYHHNTFDNTFGIYTTERSPDYQFIDIGSQGYLEIGALNFLCGYYYIKVTTNDSGDEAQDALVTIAEKVEEHLGQNKNWPEIYKVFPEGMIKYSEHYIAENFLGFEFLHSAFTADYSQNGEEFQVFIIKTNNSEEARAILKGYLEFTKQDLEVEDGTFLINDPYNGVINAVLKGNTLAGIISCDDAKIVTEYIRMLSDKL